MWEARKGDDHGQHFERRHNDGISSQIRRAESQRTKPPDRPSRNAYMAERFRAGDDLKTARERYDTTIWNGVKAADISKRFADLGRFMAAIARDRAVTWGLPH